MTILISDFLMCGSYDKVFFTNLDVWKCGAIEFNEVDSDICRYR